MTMNVFQIQSISPLDGRYSTKVQELSQYFSEYALIRYRVLVEIEWLIALSEEEAITELPTLTDEEKSEVRKLYIDFSIENALEIKNIEQQTNHDVKAVEYFINNAFKNRGKEQWNSFIHFGCTSEDINNVAYALMVKKAHETCLIQKCEQIVKTIEQQANQYRSVVMVSRTHGQLASPTTMGKEFYNVQFRLLRQLESMKTQTYLGKINGAVGNFNAHMVTYPEINWNIFAQNFIEHLGLTYNPATTQIEPHDFLAEMFHQWIRWNTILLDFSRDIWSYISVEAFQQIPIAGQTGSSTMPHKVNPIDFENAEGNLGIANALFQHLSTKLPVSRWQRDLTDSTVLRNIGVAFGYSYLACDSILKGLNKLSINQEKLYQELENSWELLGEAIQTVMRRYQIPEPYEKLKELTRGKKVNQEILKQFILSLDLPTNVKNQLLLLKPTDYLGLAKEF